jgi:hypothetical protein
MAAAGGDHLEMLVADLTGNRLEFSGAEAMQLIGVAQLAEMHAGEDPQRSIYAFPSG